MRPADDDLNTVAFTGINSPHIFNPDLDSQLHDNDLRFFDDAVAQNSPTSATRIFDEFYSSPPASRGFTESVASPASASVLSKQPLLQPQSDLNTLRQTYSGSSSNSPGTLSHGSSSSSSHQLNKTISNHANSKIKREPSRSGPGPTMDWTTADGMQNGDDPLFGLDDAALPPLDPLTDPDFTMSNQTMANDFDFDSAASSPSPFGLAMPTNTSVRSGPSTTMAFRSPGIDSPVTQTKSASPVRTHEPNLD
jgi:hypothetical protein